MNLPRPRGLKHCPMCTLPVEDHVDMMKWEIDEKGMAKLVCRAKATLSTGKIWHGVMVDENPTLEN